CESVIEDRRVFIEALRSIEPGEELTYDYQIQREVDDPPDVDAIFACRCGSARCRGSMLWPPRRLEARNRSAARSRPPRRWSAPSGVRRPIRMNRTRRLSLSSIVGAVGIVYGDIGTSPLYTMQEAVNAAGTFDAAAVLGVLSLIFWALTISVTLKYVTIIMRADNDGEGGILALFALAQRRLIPGSTSGHVIIALALSGTPFFFCDALITPAISVLSA